MFLLMLRILWGGLIRLGWQQITKRYFGIKLVDDHDKYQVHHIIPQALFDKKKYPSAGKILSCHGIDQDDFSNLIGLPKHSNSHPRKKEKHFGNAEHRSRHQGYSNAVSDAIIGIGKIKNCTIQLSKIKALQTILRTELRRGNIYLMDGSKVNWSNLLRAKGF